MADRDRKRPPEPPLDDAPDSSDAKSSGRVTFDERGNSVWEWRLETGVYSSDVSTQRLKKLELDELSIADSGVRKGPQASDAQSTPDGFNPYDSSSRQAQSPSPYDKARAQANNIAPPPAEPARRKPSDMRKLDEWIKLRKKVEQDPGE